MSPRISRGDRLLSPHAKGQEDANSAGREPRSRLDRPCDTCRRHKHMCMIPVRGEPCVSCKTRRKECTFLMAPTARKRKSKQEHEARSVRAGLAKHDEAAGQGGERAREASRATPDIFSGRVADMPDWIEPPGRNGDALEAPSMSVAGPSSGDTTDLPALDDDNIEDEETHFVGNGAFFGLIPKDAGSTAPSPSFSQQATLAFRQVSANPRLPAYFIKHPSLLYGRGPSTAAAALDEVWRLCATVGQDIPVRALTNITLPALPFVHSQRLQAAFADEGSAMPHGLIAGIIAHCTSYIPEIRPLHRSLWQQALLALEDEYRKPRLRTIQLALLLLTSRPSENVGQSEIGLARAVGSAHLLGLHMDPTNWALPQWEKSVRIRIWWTLFIHDKWRALLYGRPSNLHKSNYNVPLPSLNDADVDLVAADQTSIESSIATCRLTLIVDKLLDRFYSVQSITNPPPDLTRLAVLESIRSELDQFEVTLPEALRPGPAAEGTAPTGVRSFHLSLCGLQVVTHRTIIEVLPASTAPHVGLALCNALAACQRLSDVVLSLSLADRDMFWMPYSSHHISNAVSLLLRIALFDRDGQADTTDNAVACTIPLVDSLVSTYAKTKWDVAEAALRRIAIVLLVGSRELPVLAETYRTVAEVLGLHVASDQPGASTDQLLESLGLATGHMVDWLDTDLSWLDSTMLLSAFDSASVE